MSDTNPSSEPGPDDIDLAGFDEEFAQAPIEERGFESIPDGKYQVNVEKAELTRAKSSGNPMLKWTLRVIAPRFQGRILFRNNVLATRENIKWLKGDLHLCGLDLEKLSDLPARIQELLDVKLEVTKRTKGEGESRSENVYFNRKLTLDAAGNPEKGKGDPGGYDGKVDEALMPF